MARMRILVGMIVFLFPTLAIASGVGAPAEPLPLGEILPLWSAIPFVGILLSIALFDLVAPHFWHDHFGKISAAWALSFAVPFLWAHRLPALQAILHSCLTDYVPFIILLWGLFVTTGGIVVRGTLSGTPLVNTLMLLTGTFLASWMGTTGASMVLVRPLLRANARRKSKAHVVVFFIFLVSNIGGILTPLGDPPIFLGFLHGLPFFWTLRLLPHLAVTCLILLGVFFVVDTFLYRKEGLEVVSEAPKKEPLRIDGLLNALFLAGIMGAVMLSGIWRPAVGFDFFGVHLALQNIVRDALIVAIGLLAFKWTPPALREANGFSWFPIVQVGALFAGIFMTIVPVVAILKAGEGGALGFVVRQAESAASYFWMTGLLSSFLDNAPTYLTFFSAALGKLGLHEETIRQAMSLAPDRWPTLRQGGERVDPDTLVLFVGYLKAISVGAVFMGANTYIGNAPNFMVKAIAEENGVKMPSFLGYTAYSVVILIPTFILLGMLFF